MARIERTDQAEQDLIDIWTYIAADNVMAADRLLDEIDSVCKLLSRAPMLGRARKELGPTLRSFSVGGYLIFYPPGKNGIVVVRVLSGYRDLDRLFRP